VEKQQSPTNRIIEGATDIGKERQSGGKGSHDHEESHHDQKRERSNYPTVKLWSVPMKEQPLI
jgi:hypothetical protein